MEKNVTVEISVNINVVHGILALIGERLTDEETEQLVKEPLVITADDIKDMGGENPATFPLLFGTMIAYKVKKQREG